MTSLMPLLIPAPEPAELLAAMDSVASVIDSVIDGTIDYEPLQGLAGLVEVNVKHLELMTGTRVGELGESPDLSSYETAITAGRAYLESA